MDLVEWLAADQKVRTLLKEDHVSHWTGTRRSRTFHFGHFPYIAMLLAGLSV